MGAILDTSSTMQTDENLIGMILVDRIYRAGGDTLAASYAEFFSNDYPAPITLRKGSGWAGSNTGGRVTGQADNGNEPGG